MTIIYKPKTLEQAMAARAIALSAGSELRSPELFPLEWCKRAVSNSNCKDYGDYGVIIDDDVLYFQRRTTGGKAVHSLDELVEALSKPTKQPKELGEYGFEEENGRMGDIHVVTLLPDGRVKVGCTYVKKDLMEKLISEYQAYHKEQV